MKKEILAFWVLLIVCFTGTANNTLLNTSNTKVEDNLSYSILDKSKGINNTVSNCDEEADTKLEGTGYVDGTLSL